MSPTLPSMVPIPARPKQSAVVNTTSSPSDTYGLQLSLHYKGMRALVDWPKTYEGVMSAARSAFPALPAEDSNISLETHVRVENKKSELKTERALITPGSWPAMTRPASGAIREIKICTQEDNHGIIKAWKLGWDELKATMSAPKPRKWTRE